jgi:hypothetical protein
VYSRGILTVLSCRCGFAELDSEEEMGAAKHQSSGALSLAYYEAVHHIMSGCYPCDFNKVTTPAAAADCCEPCRVPACACAFGCCRRRSLAPSRCTTTTAARSRSCATARRSGAVLALGGRRDALDPHCRFVLRWLRCDRALFPVYIPKYLLTQSSPALLATLEESMTAELLELQGSTPAADKLRYVQVRGGRAARLLRSPLPSYPLLSSALLKLLCAALLCAVRWCGRGHGLCGVFASAANEAR